MILIFVLNIIFQNKILAPALLHNTACELRDDLVTKERMNELLPLEDGQVHQQIICKRTQFFVSTFYITILQKSWIKDGRNYNVNINYYSDENGVQKFYIASDPLFYLLIPLFFAICLVKSGQTPGKRISLLVVYNDDWKFPDLKSALKREYLKGIVPVITALYELYSAYDLFNYDIDEAAKQLQGFSEKIEQTSFVLPILFGIVVVALMLWFYFGSFIKWSGRTYWDRFAKLNTNLLDEFRYNPDKP